MTSKAKQAPTELMRKMRFLSFLCSLLIAYNTEARTWRPNPSLVMAKDPILPSSRTLPSVTPSGTGSLTEEKTAKLVDNETTRGGHSSTLSGKDEDEKDAGYATRTEGTVAATASLSEVDDSTSSTTAATNIAPHPHHHHHHHVKTKKEIRLEKKQEKLQEKRHKMYAKQLKVR
jgi:hypothetical protein